jgi:hypothetical protein
VQIGSWPAKLVDVSYGACVSDDSAGHATASTVPVRMPGEYLVRSGDDLDRPPDLQGLLGGLALIAERTRQPRGAPGRLARGRVKFARDEFHAIRRCCRSALQQFHTAPVRVRSVLTLTRSISADRPRARRFGEFRRVIATSTSDSKDLVDGVTSGDERCGIWRSMLFVCALQPSQRHVRS